MPVPRYPEVEVQLVGEDGNAFSILGRVRMAMKKHGISEDVRDEFMREATSDDYDHLLRTCMAWVTCDPD